MDKKVWLEEAKTLGLDGLEIYTLDGSNREMKWYEGKCDSFVTSHVKSYMLKAFKDGKAAIYRSEKIDDKDAKTILSSLKETALNLSDDSHRLPQKTEILPTENIHKDTVPGVKELKEFLASIEQEASKYEGIKVADIEWADETEEKHIVNSNGIDAKETYSFQYVFLELMGEKDGNVKVYYKVARVSDVYTFDKESYVKKIVDEVRARLDAKSIPGGKRKVIMEKGAMSSLFRAYVGMFYGDTYAKGISPLRDKLGTKVFGDNITIIDNPRLKEAPMSYAMDDEGVATQEKVLVDRGTFTTLLLNASSAEKLKLETNGSSGLSGETARNCYVVPGEKSFDELLETMQNGLVITDVEGLHAGVNFVTGDFSLQSRGYLVENGKRTQSVSLITVAGNIIDLFNQVEEVGNDLVWEVNSVITPSLLVKGLSISGQ